VAPTSYLFHLTSAIFRLPSSLSNPKVIRASSLVLFTSPVGEKNVSRGGAQIFIFIDDAKVQKIQMQNKPFQNLFSKSFKC
jgi:hypothetical protein